MGNREETSDFYVNSPLTYHPIYLFLEMDACNISNSSHHMAVGINHVLTGSDSLMLGLYITLLAISTPGNLLLIFVVCKNPSMQTFTNYLICNTAVSDLITTIVPGLLSIFDAMIRHDDHIWIFGGCMCKLVYTCAYWSVSVTVISLMVIAIDRYCLIMFPHRKYLTNKMLRRIVPLIWILGFIFASPSTFIMELRHDNGADVCVEHWLPPFDQKSSPKYYTIALFLFLYAIPLLQMSTIYITIALRLSGKRVGNKMRRTTTRMYNRSNDSMLPIGSADDVNRKLSEAVDINFVHNNITKIPNSAKISNSRTRANSVSSKKFRIIRMLVAIIICFVVCWSPVYIIQFVTLFHPYYANCPDAIPAWIHIIALCMQYCNGALNPMLYFVFSKTYRRGLKLSLGICGKGDNLFTTTQV